MPATATQPAPPARLEWGLLAFVLLAGFTLRAWSPTRLTIEHFDEGVYASNLAFDEDEGFSYPDRHLYAPPLVPWILELTITLFGPTVAGCFGLGILTGTATIAAVWWVTRRWFGPIAALSAATLVAFSGPHIVFSRTALTDVPMGLWFTLSLGFFGESIRQGSRGYAIAAGVAVALAWWTKYNGWLPLAIGMAGMLAWLLTARPGGAVAKRSFLCWGIAAVTAIILWSPVWWGLQSKGGYAAVAANHARYFHGLSGWWDAFCKQTSDYRRLNQTFSLLLLTAVAIPILAQKGRWSLGAVDSRSSPDAVSSLGRGNSTWSRLASVAPSLAFLLAVLVLRNRLSLDLLLPICIVTALAYGNWSRSGLARIQRIGFWILAAWFTSLLAMTPLYRPYPRIATPWILGANILLAVGSSLLWRRPSDGVASGPSSATATQTFESRAGLIFIGATLLFSVALILVHSGSELWPDRSDLARATAELRSAMQDDARKLTRKPDCVAYVYAEPAVFFQLSGVTAAGPVGDLEFASPTARRMPMPVYLVVGPHARRSERFAEQWAARGDRFEKVSEWTYRPSLVVLLDHYHPDEVRDPENRPTETIELYRLK